MESRADVKGAARFVSRFAAAGPLDGSYLVDDVARSIDRLILEAEPLIAAETGFEPPAPAKARVLSRAEWAEANIDPMLTMMAPLLEKGHQRLSSSPIGTWSKLMYGPALGAQMGTILGILSTRVLGQYDVVMGHDNEVWFVGPNIVLMERRLGFVPRDFRLWVVLHELTHRSQFEGNDWVRDHFMGLVGGLLGSLNIEAGTILGRLLGSLKDRDGAPIALRLLSEEQRESFERVQAFMSVIEGHGNFVMDRIARDTIPTQPRMRRMFRSGASTSPMNKILGKLLGLDLKRAQYEQGQKFFDAVFEHGGSTAVAACFESAEALPTLAEIRAPERWLARART